MTKPMNLVQLVIRERLRHGNTQAGLAKQWRMSAITLNLVLKGHRPASDKLLKQLGLVRVITYTYADGSTIASETPAVRKDESVQAAKTGLEKAKPRPVEIAGIESVKGAKITLDQAKVALRYKLNPGSTWSDFLRTSADTSDEAWQAYCADFGQEPSAQSTSDLKPMYAGLGNGDAVLVKAVVRGPDLRRKLALGELPPVVMINQPIANSV